MPGDMVTITLQEHETLDTAALTAAQARLLDEVYGRYLTVSPAWEPGSYRLKAGSYIGTIVLEGLRVHIRPKVPLTNLFFMLTYAYDLPQLRREQTLLAVGEDLFRFVIQILVRQVDQLVRHGIHRSYLDFEANQRFLRGRLMLTQQLQQNGVQVHRFYQQANEFTPDLLENRILKYTLWQLSRFSLDSPALRLQLRRALSAFSEVTLETVGPSRCDDVLYNRLNGAYRTPINLCQLILQHLSLEGHLGETPFATYLLPMYQVFELFVARYLQEHFRPDPDIDIEIQPQIWLDLDQKESGQPDIILRQQGRPVAILDTKYKVYDGRPGRDDRNQMFMYCHTMGVARGILIYASEGPTGPPSPYQGMTLAAATLPLSGSLEAFRQRCHAFAAQFVPDEPVARI